MVADKVFRKMEKLRLGALMLLAILLIVGGAEQTPCLVANCEAVDSYIKIGSGTLAGQTISASNSEITVSPGSLISGSFTISVKNSALWLNTVFITAATPNWGTHNSSFLEVGSNVGPFTETQTVNVSLNAPLIEGTYYIIVAGEWELSAGNVASGTNWAVGTNHWNDGNDLADWSSSMIESARSTGLITANWDTQQGIVNRYVPATAIKVIVTPLTPFPTSPIPTTPAVTTIPPTIPPTPTVKQPLLIVSQTSLKEEPEVGEEVLTTVTIQNTGEGAAKNISLTEQIPSSISISFIDGASSNTLNLVIWDGELAPNRAHSIMHTFRILDKKGRAIPVIIKYEDEQGNKKETSTTVYVGAQVLATPTPMGYISVSSPRGAVIILDEIYPQGIAPKTITVAEGSHTISLKLIDDPLYIQQSIIEDGNLTFHFGTQKAYAWQVKINVVANQTINVSPPFTLIPTEQQSSQPLWWLIMTALGPLGPIVGAIIGALFVYWLNKRKITNLR